MIGQHRYSWPSCICCTRIKVQQDVKGTQAGFLLPAALKWLMPLYVSIDIKMQYPCWVTTKSMCLAST